MQAYALGCVGTAALACSAAVTAGHASHTPASTSAVPCRRTQVGLVVNGDNLAPVTNAVFIDGNVEVGQTINGRRRNLAVSGVTTLGSDPRGTPTALITKGGAKLDGSLSAFTFRLKGDMTGALPGTTAALVQLQV